MRSLLGCSPRVTAEDGGILIFPFKGKHQLIILLNPSHGIGCGSISFHFAKVCSKRNNEIPRPGKLLWFRASSQKLKGEFSTGVLITIKIEMLEPFSRGLDLGW